MRYHPGYFAIMRNDQKYSLSLASGLALAIEVGAGIGLGVGLALWGLSYLTDVPVYSCCDATDKDAPGCRSGAEETHHPGTFKLSKKQHTCCQRGQREDGCRVGRHPNPFAWTDKLSEQYCVQIRAKDAKEKAEQERRKQEEEKRLQQQYAQAREEKFAKERERVANLTPEERIRESRQRRMLQEWQRKRAEEERLRLERESKRFDALARQYEREVEYKKRKEERKNRKYVYRSRPEKEINLNSGPVHSDWVYNANLGCDYPY